MSPEIRDALLMMGIAVILAIVVGFADRSGHHDDDDDEPQTFEEDEF